LIRVFQYLGIGLYLEVVDHLGNLNSVGIKTSKGKFMGNQE